MMTDSSERPACWSLRTEFELEPLLEGYRETYPNGDMKKYQIVYKELDAGDYLYVLLVFYNREKTPRITSFEAYLNSFCQLNNKLGAINRMGLPKPFTDQHLKSRVVGNLDARRSSTDS